MLKPETFTHRDQLLPNSGQFSSHHRLTARPVSEWLLKRLPSPSYSKCCSILCNSPWRIHTQHHLGDGVSRNWGKYWTLCKEKKEKAMSEQALPFHSKIGFLHPIIHCVATTTPSLPTQRHNIYLYRLLHQGIFSS
jgi:hypothetical protein